MKSAAERQRTACDRYFNAKPAPPLGPQFDCMHVLRQVADKFVEAQQLRHAADYDNSAAWTRTEVIELINSISEAFRNWHSIRDHDDAQAFLLSLPGNPHGA